MAARLFAVFVLLWHSVVEPTVALGNGNYSCEIFCDRGITDLNDVEVGKSPCLNFGGNKLRTVSGYLSFSAWVETLILSNNQISVVQETSLLFMDKLTTLDLSHNRLQTFPWNLSLSNLTSLSLAYNQLTSLPTETTLGTTLHILNLAYNNLTSVPEQLFFKQVTMVALKGNPWHCDCRLTLLQDWLLLHYYPDTPCGSSYIRDDGENGSIGSEIRRQCTGSVENITSIFDPPSCFTPARLTDQCVNGGNVCEVRHAHEQGYVNVTVLDNFEPETPPSDPGFTNSVTTSTDGDSISSPQPMSSTHPTNDTKDSERFHSNVTTDTPTDGPTVPTRKEREGVIKLEVRGVTSTSAMVKWVTPAFLRGSFLRLFYHEKQQEGTGEIWMDMEQRSVLIKPGFRRHQLQRLQPSTCYVVCISSHTIPRQDECRLFHTKPSGVNPLYFTVIPVPLLGVLALGCYVRIRNKRRQIRRQYLNPFQTLAENTWNSLSLFGPGVDAISLRRSAGDYHIYAVPNDDVYDDVCDVTLDPGSSVAKYHARQSYACGDAQEHIYDRACTVKKTAREGRPSTKTNAAGKVVLRRGSGSYEKACSVTLPMFKIPLPKMDTNEPGSVSLNSVYTRACSVRSFYADPSSAQSIMIQQNGMGRRASSGDVYVSPVDVGRTRVQGIEVSPAPLDHRFVDVSTESLESSDGMSSLSWEVEQRAGYNDIPFYDFAINDKNKTFSKRPVSW